MFLFLFLATKTPGQKRSNLVDLVPRLTTQHPDMTSEKDLRAEELWSRGHEFLESGSSDDAKKAFLALFDKGDWRGAYMLGWLSEKNGRTANNEYIEAARWYDRALSLSECAPPHEALGRYYYFGLGGYYDYRAAFEHLQRSDQNAVVKIMTAELLAHGLGVHQDVERAKVLYRDAGKSGYPAAWLGLMSLEKSNGNYFQVAVYFVRSLVSIIRLILKDRGDPRLTGIGGSRGTLRRNWVGKQ